MISEKLKREIQEFLKTIDSTQVNVERLVIFRVNEFNNSSVNKLIKGANNAK